jgi:hypothetical protein
MPISRYSKLNKIWENNKYCLESPNNIIIPNKLSDIWILWKDSNSLRKLAYKYYNSEEYYWIILLANNIGLESDIKLGQKIRIPINIGDVLTLL